jgi:2-dehydropantoate 2-reductase
VSPASIILVGGGGAMGATYASALSRADHHVGILEASPDLVAHGREHGLRVDEPDGSSNLLRIPITDDPSELEPAPDFLLFFVKAVHNRAAAESARGLVGQKTIVLTVQNGLGNGEVLSAIVPDERLVVGVTYQGANTVGPSHVNHYIAGKTDVGPLRPGQPLDAATAVAQLLDSAGMEAQATGDVHSRIWEKVLINAAHNPVSAVTGLGIIGGGSCAPVADLILELTYETARVAEADGAAVDAEKVIALTRAHYEKALHEGFDGKASMLLDVENRRATEIDAITGEVIARAARHDVPAPLNRVLYALVKGLEYSWTPSPSAA